MHENDAPEDQTLHLIDDEVFADEIEAIVARREAVAKRPNPGEKKPPASENGSAALLRDALEAQRAHHADGGDHACPDPDPDLGLMGLAISGGGIRSATFNLGVLQVFAKRGLLRWFDYLSTVSGGGYVGSALSSTLLYETQVEGGGGDEAPLGKSFVHTMGKGEPQLIKHLRSGRDYLAPGGLRDVVRIPAVLLRGIIINLLVVTPLVGLLAVLTAVAPPFGVFFYSFESTGFSAEQLGRGDVILENMAVFFMPTLLVVLAFGLWSVLFPLVARFRRRATWAVRNRFELSFSTILLLIGGVFVINLLPYLYYVVFNGTFEDTPPWRIGAAAIVAVLPVATSLRAAAARSSSFTRMFDKLKLLAAGLLGPLILLSMYLGMSLLVLAPLTTPFGADDSALNVAAWVLPAELTQETSTILDLGGTTPYSRWANQLWDRVSSGGNAEREQFYQFLTAALQNSDAELTASLRDFKHEFGPALALRNTALGMRLFGDNRFLAPLRKDLDAETVRWDELLFTDRDSGPGSVLAMARASKALRKDIVLTHSAILLAIMACVILYVGLLVNINKTGLHRFYRDRLSRAYLYDPRDPEGRAGSADGLKLSELDASRSGGPYHLLNATLNIPATEIADLQGRASDFFMMSPRWCGSSATGYHRTTDFEELWDRDTSLATALAVSGAAAAPRMGVDTSPSLALIMTLLNIRLDYWVPNPGELATRFRPSDRVPGPTYLLREISGRMTVRTPFVNLSDGGHIENLGLYALLQRRCKYIVVCDAEQDSDMILSSLGKVTAYARMDDGIWIDWGDTLERLKKDPETGFSEGHWAVGKIHYANKTGRIVYLKSSMCGKEWPDMMAYHAKNPDFPQQSTGDQFFDEEQFEAYRALGYLIAGELFDGKSYRVADIEQWFDRLEELARGRADNDPSAPV